jgi:acetyl esterase
MSKPVGKSPSFGELLMVRLMRPVVRVAMSLQWRKALTEVARVEDRTAATPDAELPIRSYTPSGDGPFPVIAYFHGGGWVICDLDTHDALCRDLCRRSGCLVVSVDYRLAPEHKYPAAADDCYAATRWIAEHAAELGADAGTLFVAGDSAGGNLAAVVAQRVRDEGGPALAGQILIYPVTDYHTPPTASYIENARAKRLSRKRMIWFWRHYLNEPAEAEHPHASPLRAARFDALPPALVFTAEYDPLRDEGEQYAQHLEAAGIPTQTKRFAGLCHGFLGLEGPTDYHRGAIDEIGAWVEARIAARD